jgi:GxxExxY protein
VLKVISRLSEKEESTVSRCIDCGIAVHRELGPGFKEAIYHQALRLELASRGIRFESEKPIMVRYKSWEIPGQKVDLLIEGTVIVEIKAVPNLIEIHRYQLQSYLRTMNLKIGLLMNFRSRLLKHGIRRVTP